MKYRKEGCLSEKMERSRVFLVVFAFSLLVIDCSGAEVEGKSKDQNISLDGNSTLPSNDQKSESKSVLDPVKDEKEKKDEDKEGRLQEASKKDPGKIKQLNSEENPKVATDKNDLNEESPVKGKGKKKTSKEESKSKVDPKEGSKEGGSDPLNPLEKESSRGEECGLSHRCTDEEDKLIACLRFPGNEATFSLFIQYKGEGPLTVNISAPDFVQLDTKTVQFQEKDDKKVKVSFGEGGNETFIVLKAEKGVCNIDFKDLIAQNPKEKTSYSDNSTYINPLIRTPSIVFISLGALLLLASAWMYVRFQRRHLPRNGARYQKLETELPISGGGKTESYVTSGWDDSWGDSWDDEEAPKTPSIPLTPSLSSKGLAARRFNKEGRKD